MDFGNQLILVCAGLVFVSIFAGLISQRIGAPLLLVFLALGMLAGEDGPGGIDFDDFEAAYMIGATALAIVLFDGGLRTPLDRLRLAAWPALLLATFGVVITAAVTGAYAKLVLGLGWLEGLLIGSVVASTDAAAVFFLLHLKGTNLVRRVGATLEVESGLNDPMAVFLTVTLIELVQFGLPESGWPTLSAFGADFLLQIAGGAMMGLAGGLALLRLINAVQLASGLYPILALSGALCIFAGAQVIGASGFLAAYLAGLVLGNRRHRATQLIDRFQDGLAWLSQIVMFLMLGLLVTPSELLANLWPAVSVAAFLIVLGRPLAVLLCLSPFRFAWRERSFVAWVGLRGAVPIFLGTLPVLADLPNAALYFQVAFVVVLSSLVVQGWTLNAAARRLNLALPPAPEPARRLDLDLPPEMGREMAAFAVQESSAAAGRPADERLLGGDVDVIAVIRDGELRMPERVARLAAGDHIVLVAPADRLEAVDRMFGRPPKADRHGRDEAVLGEFAFDGSIAVGDLVASYDLPVPAAEHDLTLDAFMRRHLRGTPLEGDRLRLGTVELVVRRIDHGRVVQVGIELDPQPLRFLRLDLGRIWWRELRRRLRLGV